jgi:hypothetical protein
VQQYCRLCGHFESVAKVCDVGVSVKDKMAGNAGRFK